MKYRVQMAADCESFLPPDVLQDQIVQQLGNLNFGGDIAVTVVEVPAEEPGA